MRHSSWSICSTQKQAVLHPIKSFRNHRKHGNCQLIRYPKSKQPPSHVNAASSASQRLIDLWSQHLVHLHSLIVDISLSDCNELSNCWSVMNSSSSCRIFASLVALSLATHTNRQLEALMFCSDDIDADVPCKPQIYWSEVLDHACMDMLHIRVFPSGLHGATVNCKEHVHINHISQR